jgi:hypothetical protein
MLDWGKTANKTYDYVPAATWTAIESEVGMICANMPGIAALIRHVAPRFLSGTGLHSPITNKGAYSAAPSRDSPLSPRQGASRMGGLRPIHLIQMHQGRDRQGMIRVADDESVDAQPRVSLRPKRPRTRPKGRVFIVHDSQTGMARLV